MASLRVLHVIASALQRSETFIQRQLGTGRYQPEVLTWSRAEQSLFIPCPVRVIGDGRIGIGRWSRRAAFVRRHLDTLRNIQQAAPDVVHAHFGPVGCFVDRHCSLLRRPLVVSFYGFDVGTAATDQRTRRDYQRLFATAAAVTAEGPVLAQRLCALGADPRRVRLLPLCLPDSALEPPQRLVEFETDPLRLLQVARFIEKKGIDTSIRALAIARQQGLDVTLEIVGDGPLKGKMEQLSQELGVAEAVHFRGFVQAAELPSLYAQAHVLMQPSRTASDGDTEGGHPTTLIEAQAAGLSVIASKHADIPFVVRPGRGGWLADEQAPAESFAALIVEAGKNRAALAAAGAAARRAVLRRHGPVHHAALRERIYREARRTFAKRRDGGGRGCT